MSVMRAQMIFVCKGEITIGKSYQTRVYDQAIRVAHNILFLINCYNYIARKKQPFQQVVAANCTTILGLLVIFMQNIFAINTSKASRSSEGLCKGFIFSQKLNKASFLKTNERESGSGILHGVSFRGK